MKLFTTHQLQQRLWPLTLRPLTFLKAVALPVLLLIVGLPAQAAYEFNFPEPVTPVAHSTLEIHNEFVIIISVLFIVVFAIMIYSMVKHRKQAGVQPSKFSGPTNRAQWFWVMVPFAILLFIDIVLLGIPAYYALEAMENTRHGAELTVKATGSQWKWQYEYPSEGLKFLSVLTTPQDQIDNKAPKNPEYLLEVDNPMVVPVGKKVRVLLTSTDVIHGWWVPQFGVKRDAVPGYLRETWVQVERPGVYRGQCSELCGQGHGYMPIVVEAVSDADFKTWVAKAKQKADADSSAGNREWTMDELMTKGKEVYAAQCQICHQPNGQGQLPAFPALAGSKLINAPLVDKDGKFHKDYHIDRVLNGKPGTAMQAFKNILSDVQLAAVITYERNSFGNKMGDSVQPSMIKNFRNATPEAH